MSKYKTLKELLGDATESKGRMFTEEVTTPDYWFEPRFRENHLWYGKNNVGDAICWGDSTSKWKEIKPKTVYYRAHYKVPYTADGGFVVRSSAYFKSKADLIKDFYSREIIEIEEREFEV